MMRLSFQIKFLLGERLVISKIYKLERRENILKNYINFF